MQRKQAVLGGVHTRTAGYDDRETGAIGSPLKAAASRLHWIQQENQRGVEAELQGARSFRRCLDCVCVHFLCIWWEEGMPLNIWQHVSSITVWTHSTAVDPGERITQTLPALFPVLPCK